MGQNCCGLCSVNDKVDDDERKLLNNKDLSGRYSEQKSPPFPLVDVFQNNENRYMKINEKYQSNQSSLIPLTSRFEIGEVIGIGSTSTCYICVDRKDQNEDTIGELFALKVIDKKKVEMKFSGLLEQFHVEIDILKKLRHPNIIHLQDVYENDRYLAIVLEYMGGGELFDYIVSKGTLSEQEASNYLRQVTSAVAFMHKNNIIHRDLKPENLLLTKDKKQVKIIDFGLAKILSEKKYPVAQSFLGTRGYLAPEMIQRESYTKSIDIWALGIIAYVLLCGCLPFDDDSQPLSPENMNIKFHLRFPEWSNNLSESARDLLRKLLDVNPINRISAEEALNHPWVSGKKLISDNYLKSPQCIRKRMLSPAVINMHLTSKTRYNNNNNNNDNGVALESHFKREDDNLKKKTKKKKKKIKVVGGFNNNNNNNNNKNNNNSNNNSLIYNENNQSENKIEIDLNVIEENINNNNNKDINLIQPIIETNNTLPQNNNNTNGYSNGHTNGQVNGENRSNNNNYNNKKQNKKKKKKKNKINQNDSFGQHFVAQLNTKNNVDFENSGILHSPAARREGINPNRSSSSKQKRIRKLSV